MKFNWSEINEPATGYADLPTGGYVCKVVDAWEEQNYTSNFGDTYDRIVVLFDVAEGEYADFFATNEKPDFTHQHEFRITDDESRVDERDRWRYHQFLDRFLPAVKASNDVHGVADVAHLKGLLFGATIRHRYYTKRDGSDGNTLQIQGFYAADSIRDGSFKEPTDLDKRETRKSAPNALSYDDAEIPFS